MAQPGTDRYHSLNGPQQSLSRTSQTTESAPACYARAGTQKGCVGLGGHSERLGGVGRALRRPTLGDALFYGSDTRV